MGLKVLDVHCGEIIINSKELSFVSRCRSEVFRECG